MNSASGSTKRLINHGQAMRSTLAFSRVTHFIAVPLSSLHSPQSNACAAGGYRSERFSFLRIGSSGVPCQFGIERIVERGAPLQRYMVVGADRAQAPAEQVQAWRHRLHGHLLHHVGLI